MNLLVKKTGNSFLILICRFCVLQGSGESMAKVLDATCSLRISFCLILLGKGMNPTSYPSQLWVK